MIRCSCWPIYRKRSCSNSPPACPRPTWSWAGRPGRASLRGRWARPCMAAATNKGKFLVQLESANAGGRARLVRTGRRAGQPTSPTTRGKSDNLRRYLVELGRRDFAAGESGFAAGLAARPCRATTGWPAMKRAASATRADCVQLWDRSRHGHAWQTLAGRGLSRRFLLPAMPQHRLRSARRVRVGFGRSLTVRSVGCESCHGPSQAHVRKPKVRHHHLPPGTSVMQLPRPREQSHLRLRSLLAADSPWPTQSPGERLTGSERDEPQPDAVHGFPGGLPPDAGPRLNRGRRAVGR